MGLESGTCCLFCAFVFANTVNGQRSDSIRDYQIQGAEMHGIGKECCNSSIGDRRLVFEADLHLVYSCPYAYAEWSKSHYNWRIYYYVLT